MSGESIKINIADRCLRIGAARTEFLINLSTESTKVTECFVFPAGYPAGDGDRIVAEEWGNQLLVYFYDDVGLPMGMMYRNSSYADKQFDYYLYEKDVFGNIIAIYNASGTKVASYCY